MNNPLITYSCQANVPGVRIITANTSLPLFGRLAKFSISSYCFNQHGGSGVGLSFGLRPFAKTDRRDMDGFAADPDGKVAMGDGSAGHYRAIEQEVVIPYINGQMLAMSDLSAGGVEGGRVVCTAVLRSVESIVESVRLAVRKNLGKSVADKFIKLLNDRYNSETHKAAIALVKSINWKLMLMAATVDEQSMSVIDYTLANNPPRLFDIAWAEPTDITPIQNVHFQFQGFNVADLKATALLRIVCGAELAAEFMERGSITFKKNGYTFIVKPHSFVECYDPDNRRGSLCIHTVGLSCNPIDELSIAYLNIMNHFDEYMKTAILQGHEPGFQKYRAA